MTDPKQLFDWVSDSFFRTALALTLIFALAGFAIEALDAVSGLK